MSTDLNTVIQNLTGTDYYVASMTRSGLEWTAFDMIAANVPLSTAKCILESATFAHLNAIVAEDRRAEHGHLAHEDTNPIAHRIIDEQRAKLLEIRAERAA